MSLSVKQTQDLVSGNSFKLKALIYGPPGVGKTTFCATAPNPGFAACETGHGSGLLPVASANVAYIEPTTYAELEALCTGQVFKDKDTIVIDSFTELCSSIIKDEALAVPRSRGESVKRGMGVPELDDYNTMGELARRLLRQLTRLDKHVLVTTLIKTYQPANVKEGKAERIGGPDLPGAMSLASAAMFDHVLWLKVRPAQRPGKDGKPERYMQRYFQTVGSDQYVAKSRSSIHSAQILPPEVVFNPETGEGCFPDLLAKIAAAYASLKV